MSIGLFVSLLLVGVVVGTISGMIGIGGGLVVIPLLMFLFGLSQKQATGTSLAMLLPPIGLFAVLSYARAGNVWWSYATLLAIGFAAGGWLGAAIVNRHLVHPTTLRVSFALFLIYVAGNLLFRSGGRARAALETLLMMAAFAGMYILMRFAGRAWNGSHGWGDTYRDRLRAESPDDYNI